MTTFTVVFVNYYDGSLLNDGTVVNVYNVGVPPAPQNLLTTAVVGQFPSTPHMGEATFILGAETIYQIEFVGTNTPTGSHYMVVTDQTILTVPIFYGPSNVPAIFTKTSAPVTLVDPANLINLPILNTNGFSVGTYIIFAGQTGVFIAVVSEVLTNALQVVVADLLVGNAGDTVAAGAFISQFAPDDFKGIQGAPGSNGNGSTLTAPISAILVPNVGDTVTFDVLNGAAFPNASYILVSDNTHSFTAFVTGGGTTNVLTTFVTGVSATAPIGPSAVVTFAGQPGPIGLTGNTGASGMMGLTGTTGPQGFGATFTTAPITCPTISASGSLSVVDNSAFPVNSYFLATDGVSSTISGQVLQTSATSGVVFTCLSSLGTTLASGSTVTFSGPMGLPSTVPGPIGLTGPPGFGLPGHGASNTTQSIVIYPIGTLIPVYVNDALGFPPLSYVLITDYTYSITGQVFAWNPAAGQLSVRINTINNGLPGISIQKNAVVTYSGPPGQAGVTRLGDLGTVLYKDVALNPPVMFNSASGLTTPSVIETFAFLLPNNLPINYRVVVEFVGNVITNQDLSFASNVAYIGLASTAAQAAVNTASTFAGVSENIQGPFAAPVIILPSIIADVASAINTPANFNTSNQVNVKFAGTFNSGIQLDFSVVAAAVQPATTFFVQGMITVTCYPLYLS